MIAAYPAPSAAGDVKPVWIDLLEPTSEERDRISREFGLRVPSREALEEIESSSRLRAEGQVLTMSMPLTVPAERAEQLPAPLGLILSPNLFVSVHFTEVHGLADVRARLDASATPVDSTWAFAALIEAMVDYRADLIESISAEISAVSKRVFARHTPRTRRVGMDRALREMLATVGAAGERLSEIRESLLGLQRIVGFACEMAHGWLSPEIRARLATAKGDIASLGDYEAHLWSKIHFLLDAILGFISTQQNDSFKVLTIVSVVGIPPTLIASMYGMNFDTIHEYHWRYGYAWGLFLIVFSAILPTAWFKWRGWW